MRNRRIIAFAIALLLMLSPGLTGPAHAAEDAQAMYIIDGQAEDGGYTLTLRIEGLYAFTGRAALAFDTEVLRLDGRDDLSAFRMARGTASVAEVRPESEMVSNEGGYVCLAWYCTGRGIDARQSPQEIASIRFVFRDGHNADDIDAGSFRLLAVENGDKGPFRSALSLQGQGDVAPINYEYETNAQPCGVRFTYEGSERPAANGRQVVFACRSVLDQPVAAVVTVSGKSYHTDASGNAEAALVPGEYLYVGEAVGYGTVRGRFTVTQGMTVDLEFVSDADLVAQAEQTLEIGYQPGDSAEHVTGTLNLVSRMDSGVTVQWQSSVPGTVTREGLVYLPESKGVEVTLTASLRHGSASAEKTFTVYVCSKEELRKAQGGTGTGSGTGILTGTGKIPEFQDLAGYDWARASIELLTGAGIISGTSETTYSPGAGITRGDFVALLMRMLDTAGTANVAFDDVPKDSYYFQEIAQARVLGIAQGTGDNLFHPNDPISRQDMIVFTMRAMEKTGYIRLTGERTDLSGFTDSALVADYAYEDIAHAVGQGLIVGGDGKLNPRQNTTRAEAAVFIANIYRAHND